MDSIRLKFPEEKHKLEFLAEVYPAQKEVEDKIRKLELVPFAFRSIPYVGLIGAGIHGIKKGWIKSNPSAIVAAALVTEPVSRLFAEIGNRIIEKKKNELRDMLKAYALSKALQYENVSFSIPSGEIKIG